MQECWPARAMLLNDGCDASHQSRVPALSLCTSALSGGIRARPMMAQAGQPCCHRLLQAEFSQKGTSLAFGRGDATCGEGREPSALATLAGLAAFAFLVSLVMEWEGAPALSWISYASSRRKYSFLICMGTCGLLADSGLHALATCRHCLHQRGTRRAEDASRIAPPACTGWHECQPLNAAPEMYREVYVPIEKRQGLAQSWTAYLFSITAAQPPLSATAWKTFCRSTFLPSTCTEVCYRAQS